MGTHFSSTHSLCLILTPCLHHMTFEEKSYFAYLLKIVISLPNCNFHVASKIIRSQRCRKASNKNLDALYYRHEWFILLLRLHIHSSYYKAQLCTNNKAKVFKNWKTARSWSHVRDAFKARWDWSAPVQGLSPHSRKRGGEGQKLTPQGTAIKSIQKTHSKLWQEVCICHHLN